MADVPDEGAPPGGGNPGPLGGQNGPYPTQPPGGTPADDDDEDE
jgi:hypothetical protein